MPGMYAPQGPPAKKTSKDVTPYPGLSQQPAPSARVIDTDVQPIAADGVDGTGHFVTVDPTVFPNIASALDREIAPLEQTLTPLRGVLLKPGHFNAATRYHELIGPDSADGGLVETYGTNVDSVLAVLRNMVTALKALGDRYTTADDLANANANDIQKIMSGVLTPLSPNIPTDIPGYRPPDPDDKPT